MNYRGGQDQRYNGGGGQITDGYEYEGEKNYYGQQTQPSQQLPSFPFSTTLRGSQQAPPTHHAYHGGLHQPSPGLLGDRILPPMSSVARGGPTAAGDLGVSALSAAAAAHQMSRLGEAFKDSLAHHTKPPSAISPYGVSVPPQYMPQASSTGSGHTDRLYGGSAFSHASSGSGQGGSLSEKSSPRSSRGSADSIYGLPAPSGRGSIQLPAPSGSQVSHAQLGGSGAAHQAAVSLSHIAGASSNSQSSASSQPPAPRTAASMNPKDLLELYSKWDQIDTKAKRSKTEEVQAEEVRKERHNMAEKRRRSDMNGAIDRLKSLLPQQVTNDRRLTKVEVLAEAADHLTQVQNLCAKLITENKRLRAMIPGVKLEDDETDLTRDDETDLTRDDPSDGGGVAVESDSAVRSDRGRRHSDSDRAAGERRSSDGSPSYDEDGEDGREAPAKRQRRDSPGENSDSSNGGSGRESEGGGSQGDDERRQSNGNSSSGGGGSSNNSGRNSGSGSGEDERDDEIVIDTRSDDEGRDSDNSNDGMTSKQRMANAELGGGGGGVSTSRNNGNHNSEPTSFSGLTFPQSSDMHNGSSHHHHHQQQQQQQQLQQHHHGVGHGLKHLHQQQQQHHHLHDYNHHHQLDHHLQHGQRGGV